MRCAAFAARRLLLGLVVPKHAPGLISRTLCLLVKLFCKQKQVAAFLQATESSASPTTDSPSLSTSLHQEEQRRLQATLEKFEAVAPPALAPRVAEEVGDAGVSVGSTSTLSSSSIEIQFARPPRSRSPPPTGPNSRLPPPPSAFFTNEGGQDDDDEEEEARLIARLRDELSVEAETETDLTLASKSKSAEDTQLWEERLKGLKAFRPPPPPPPPGPPSSRSTTCGPGAPIALQRDDGTGQGFEIASASIGSAPALDGLDEFRRTAAARTKRTSARHDGGGDDDDDEDTEEDDDDDDDDTDNEESTEEDDDSDSDADGDGQPTGKKSRRRRK